MNHFTVCFCSFLIRIIIFSIDAFRTILWIVCESVGRKISRGGSKTDEKNKAEK